MLHKSSITSKSVTKNIFAAIFAPLACAWHNRELLKRFIFRDVQARFRGTMLGSFWVIVGPLVKLGAYTFIFGVIIRPRWQSDVNDPILIAFIYFSGLILFDFLVECTFTASNLIRENRVFIKKVVFPVEVLAWVALGHATFRYVIAMAMLLTAFTALKGPPPVETLLIPFFFSPFALIILGLIWFISALAVYVRDIGHALNAFLPIIMFGSPVFFPLSAVPAQVQVILLFNPLTFPLEQTRSVLLGTGFEAWFGLAIYIAVAISISALGFRFFTKLRLGFADVL